MAAEAGRGQGRGSQLQFSGVSSAGRGGQRREGAWRAKAGSASVQDETRGGREWVLRGMKCAAGWSALLHWEQRTRTQGAWATRRCHFHPAVLSSLVSSEETTLGESPASSRALPAVGGAPFSASGLVGTGELTGHPRRGTEHSLLAPFLFKVRGFEFLAPWSFL